MSLMLHELGGREGQRYSQFSWRTRLALAHKGLDAEFRPVRVSDKAALAFSGQEKVPVLADGDTVIADSWAIAEHLEAAYPDRPALFGGEVGRGLTRFVSAWVDRQLIPKLVPILMLDLVENVVDAEDGEHLRTGIEKAFRRPLEELAAARETELPAFRRLLDPARTVLKAQPCLSGGAPAYADHILFSLFQWARIVSPQEVLDPGDAPLRAWRELMLDAYGGLARSAPPA